jgi:hypothetical protein
MRARLTAFVLTTGVVVVGSLVMAPGTAYAATYTSTGLRCTVVGTSGPDRITGTSGNDVICGLGGNDVIDAGAGADYVDAGDGGDIVHGGTGNDRLAGGTGGDRLFGDDGADVLSGQANGDALYGGNGPDTISGSGGGDVVVGGADNDRLSGGDDGDVVVGDGGTDVVNGDSGNDDLTGGSGADTLQGGAGTNWCEFSSLDVRYSCVVDAVAPSVPALSLQPTSVDVTGGAKRVVAKVRVTDDTGVRSVQVGAQYEDASAYANGGQPVLTSGSIRDGWWTVTLTVPRYIDSGSMTVNVFTRDRVGRQSSAAFPAALKVISANPDLAPPVVRSLTLSPTTVDVRSAAKSVTATVRITDDTAGVGTAYLCPAHMFADGFRQSDGCPDLQLVSGSRTDGTWRASLPIARGDVGGSWNVQVWVEDASTRHGMQYWVGPDQYAYELSVHGPDATGTLPLPNGSGRFTVVGISDNNAPVLAKVTVSPPTVVSMDGPHTVTVDVTATDAEGVKGVGLSMRPSSDGSSAELSTGEATLVSGTVKNGVWRIPVEVPQGTPPGTYYSQVWVEDLTHWSSWVSPGSPYADQLPSLTSTQAPGGAVLTVQ